MAIYEINALWEPGDSDDIFNASLFIGVLEDDDVELENQRSRSEEDEELGMTVRWNEVTVDFDGVFYGFGIDFGQGYKPMDVSDLFDADESELYGFTVGGQFGEIYRVSDFDLFRGFGDEFSAILIPLVEEFAQVDADDFFETLSQGSFSFPAQEVTISLADLAINVDQNDEVTGTGGADNYDLGAGNDIARLGNGNDEADGDGGNDRIFGQNGNDDLDGGKGNDRLDGGRGSDDLDGGAGRDTLVGGGGGDDLDGGRGNDTLNGGGGRDDMSGGVGRDTLKGGAGNDTLEGGRGNDTLDGGRGADTLTGGGGRDTFVFSGGKDTVTDFTARDRIDVGGEFTLGTTDDGDVVLNAGNGRMIFEGITDAGIVEDAILT